MRESTPVLETQADHLSAKTRGRDIGKFQESQVGEEVAGSKNFQAFIQKVFLSDFSLINPGAA